MVSQEITQQIIDRIKFGLNGRVHSENVTPNILIANVSDQDLVATVQNILNELNGRFITSIGIDKRELAGHFEVNNAFSLDRDKLFLIVRTEINPVIAAIPSLTPLIPGANWAEREVRDMIGVTPIGHPDPRRLVLPDDWPEGIHPLRRDFRFNEHPERVTTAKSTMKPRPEDSSVFPIGPFFPTLEEPVFINLFVHGERIEGVDYRGFFNHRGIEKLADSELTYHQIPFIAERICGICGLVHSGCFSQAIEEAVGIEIPDRARYLRTIIYEIERIHSHLLWVGLACHFIGFDTLFMQSWRIREPVMWLAEYLTGNRKTYGTTCIGGLTRDLPEDTAQRIPPVIDRIEAEVRTVLDAILGDSSLRLRLQGSGVLSEQDAKDYCVAGPTARGSGVDIDARRDHPYAAYNEMDFEVCIENGCDNWARTLVRIRELLESIKIIRQALERLPAGPILAEIKEIPAYCVGVSTVEAPRGEVFHYVFTGAGQRPYRWRVRAPSYNNLQSVPVLLKGMSIADAPISIGSLDPCFSCTERLSVVDEEAGTIRVYRQEELMKMSR
jgi:Ni,Fe-hydrogenase III large subunit/Ni,Fe-hydrogenase III component G